jgi:hypothetical protein
MFWTESDAQRKADERRAFMTDLSLLGGLIIAAVDTEGKPSLGWRGRRAARKVSEAVTAALPVGAASGGALADSAIAERLGHGLHVGAERGREFAHVARERAPGLAGAANAPPNWRRWRGRAPTAGPRAGALPNLPTWRANERPRSQVARDAPPNLPTWRAGGRRIGGYRPGRAKQRRGRWH